MCLCVSGITKHRTGPQNWSIRYKKGSNRRVAIWIRVPVVEGVTEDRRNYDVTWTQLPVLLKVRRKVNLQIFFNVKSRYVKMQSKWMFHAVDEIYKVTSVSIQIVSACDSQQRRFEVVVVLSAAGRFRWCGLRRRLGALLTVSVPSWVDVTGFRRIGRRNWETVVASLQLLCLRHRLQSAAVSQCFAYSGRKLYSAD